MASLSINHFRCISAAEISFDSRVTAIHGPNASGKTSLLEAIFFLSHGRSFRSPVRAELISTASDRLRLVASLLESDTSSVAGLEFAGSEMQLRLGGRPAQAWQLARALPVQVIDPSVHRILEEGSARRRRLIDWGVFHVKHQFLDGWRKYQRVLAQRNALLQKAASDGELQVWDAALVAASIAVHRDRLDYIQLLTPRFEQLGTELLTRPVTIRYRQGWSSDEEFADALATSRVRERRQRTTVVGPHRSDVSIEVDGAIAKKHVSRGQQKLLASALILAQIELRAEAAPSPVCLLLDDPAAELDADNLGKLLRVIERMPAQIIVTSLVEPTFAQLPVGRSFHVEQGKFRQVI
ncbi:MAG: DNA replication and repair protein RecF [Steroidobacteraceae bacterium]